MISASIKPMNEIIISMRLNYLVTYLHYRYNEKAIKLITRTLEDLEKQDIQGAEHFTTNIKDLFSTMFFMFCIEEEDEVRIIIDKIRIELQMQDEIVRRYFLQNDVDVLPYDIREHIVSFI